MNICGGECSGCGLCAAVCPAKAIGLQPDNGGFLYPVIDPARCTGCMLCRKSCPVNRAKEKSGTPESQHCYYAIAADGDMVTTASSGGVFPMLAKQVLSRHGAVVGAAFDRNFAVKLVLIEHEKDLGQLLQAKYVQSEIPAELFQQVLEVLKSGRRVLFSGTPCQIAALKSFLKGGEYPNLLCAEVICNSVPSPGVWQSYLHHIAAQTGGTVKQVAFRDKSDGWHKFALVIDCGKVKVAQCHKDSPYMQLFLQKLISRKSCTDCQFKCGRSGADISLGDFWKLHKIAPELNNHTGASMAITHTAAGEKALREGDFAAFQEFPMSAVKLSNPRFFQSLESNPLRDKYFEKFAAQNQQWFAPDEFLDKNSQNKLWHRLCNFFKKICS